MKINTAYLMQLAEAVVENQGPDFVYRNIDSGDCFYVPLSELRQWDPEKLSEGDRYTWDKAITPVAGDNREITGCIAGRILDLAGRKEHRMPRYIGKTVAVLAEDHPDMLTTRAKILLNLMQSTQDRGASWGTALDRAKHDIANDIYGHVSDE